MTSTPASPILSSPGFADWMAQADVSIAFTTYQAGRLFLLGRRDDGSLRANERQVEHCQGLWTDGETLWASSRSILWRFRNDLASGARSATGADRRFVPREGRVTGDLDVHDIGIGRLGDSPSGPIFCATGWNCLATISDDASFRPLWRPRFVSAMVPEDRCHLNGLAMRDGRPAFVTAVSRSDVADGWRERRQDGGVVVDVASGEIVLAGLSMPHSPRWHRDRLWLLNSGAGSFGWVDPAEGRFHPIAFCPGYARGLAMIGRHAVIGLSRPRHNQTFAGLPLDAALAEKDAAPRCGLLVVDCETGHTIEWLRIEQAIDELYDVAILPGVAQPEAIGFVGDQLARTVSVGIDTGR